MSDRTLFRHGSTWVRVDVHLHTRKDKEFQYTGEENDFIKAYVEGLKRADIRIGFITNHNKFDYDEFRALQRKARREEIYLLPGVELSVKDGANGIHTLVIFSNAWIENGDHVNPFLNVAFKGKLPNDYENENGRTTLSLIDTMKELEGYHRDFFLIFAHVEDEKGLWKELEGGRITELGKDNLFRRNTLGFQKVRTHDVPDRKCRTKVKEWLDNWYPAEVEGSDCKKIDEIGKGEKCFLKLGSPSFEAVKYALSDHANRVATAPKHHERSFIHSVSFEGAGGTLDGKTVYLSPELNTFIGIRGSGKSSILEVLRYALDISFGEKTADRKYKEDLVGHTLGSGGKMTVQAIDKHGRQYEVRRIYRELPDVYVNGVLQPGVSIRETVVHKPIYFGQKDLSNTGDGFEKDLVEKLLGEKLAAIRIDIEDQWKHVEDAVRRLRDLSNTEEKKREYQAKKQDAEFRLQIYKDHGVEEKLQQQMDFDTDAGKCTQVAAYVRDYLANVEAFINQHEDDLKNQRIYTSRQNQAFFDEFFTIFDKIVTAFDKIKRESVESQIAFDELEQKASDFEGKRAEMKEEFAKIERDLAAQLKEEGARAIRPDEFKQLHKTVETSKRILDALERQEVRKQECQNDLLRQLSELNSRWHAEYQIIATELEKVNRNHAALQIKAHYKGDKDAFLYFMKSVFKGSKIRETTFSMLINEYPDFVEIYKDFNNAKATMGNSSDTFERYFNENLPALLTWQTPHRFVIEYYGKELKHHSLGQRASALMLFVLSQQENDVILIDQPEDDLDNQTIYEDVIKLLRQMKPTVQFIFATHNANFPVLGDAEQIFSCAYADDIISMKSGSIDSAEMQKEVVDIMEGGKDAFEKRKKIYDIWNLRNS